MEVVEHEYVESLEAAAQLLDAVDHVLDAIDAGTFGQCEACGERIDLDVLRTTPLSMACERHLDLTLGN
jgi:RNA polymerase-binding transcription factor DksA